MEMTYKQNSLDEAVKLVSSGSTLALGGLTLYRRPMAFVITLLKHYYLTGEPNDLTLLSFTGSLESDLLVGAGMASRIRSCYFGLEVFGLAPMFTYYANRGEIEIIEETEASIAWGLRAQIAGVGFMPGRGWLGTDLPKLRPDLRTIIDPYTKEELMAFPAIKPDVGVIHALKTDQDGNSIIGGNKGVDEELMMTAEKVIITTEKIVPSLSDVDLIAPKMDVLVLAPGGAAPSSCHPYYPLDGEFLLSYTEQVSDPQSFYKFVHEWLGT
jgi:glutaconate CoA-transferase subunit A